jgi:pimeloyl-ACP methyl ester carboxylesterase
VRRPTRLSWDVAGGGPPLLLLHGLGATRDEFAGLRPSLEAEHTVLAPDLPGTGASPALRRRPTVPAVADVLEADLSQMGIGDVHVLGVSLGARIALELAGRHRARSVVAISPSGMNLPPERAYQGLALATTRLFWQSLHPVIAPLAHSWPARGALVAGLRTWPWRVSEIEARSTGLGFADSADFWRLLWWAILADVPAGLDEVRCPVTLAQGTADLLAGGQTPRYLQAVPGARFAPLPGGGHSPESDTPETILHLVRETSRRADAMREPPITGPDNGQGKRGWPRPTRRDVVAEATLPPASVQRGRRRPRAD